MLLVYNITQNLIGQTVPKVKTERSYHSKAEIKSAFLKKHTEGETETEAFKLPKPMFDHAEILAENNHAGIKTTLEIMHTDQVPEV